MKKFALILIFLSIISGCAGISKTEIISPTRSVEGIVISENIDVQVSSLEVKINFYMPAFPMSEQVTISTVRTDQDGKFNFIVPFEGLYQIEIGEIGHHQIWGFESFNTQSQKNIVTVKIKRQNWGSN